MIEKNQDTLFKDIVAELEARERFFRLKNTEKYNETFSTFSVKDLVV